MANHDAAELNDNGLDEPTARRTERVREAAGKALGRVSDAYGDARNTISDAYDAARDKVAGARLRAADEIEENPVVAVVGGLALGVVAAALIPQTKRETKVLGAVGGQINKAAKDAAAAARDAGKAKIGELGLNEARANVGKIVSGITGKTAS